ncbi:MAG: TolC family protein [Magnetococcales bacterium]|nr:TolC family protein [Magnetococcales bacterium]
MPVDNRFSLLLTLLFGSLLLTGCETMLDPVSDFDVRARMDEDRKELFTAQEPVRGPITMYEAMARAIKYNVEKRLKLMEEEALKGKYELSRLELLPRLSTTLSSNARSNDSGGVSRSLLDGSQSLVASTSQEKNLSSADMSLTWNVLDFGISYIRSKQSANDILIAREKRRKVIQDIIKDVRTSYWRAVGAAYLKDDVDALLKKTTLVLQRAREMEEKQIRAPLKTLNFQRTLLQVERKLKEMRHKMWIAKTELAALMNLPPGTPFSLALPTEKDLMTPNPPAAIDHLEYLALYNRAELRQEDYATRNSAEEIKLAYLSLFPGLQISDTATWNSNSMLANNTWMQAAVQVSGNLVNLFTAPTVINAAEQQKRLADMRRIALSMAVITQVHVAYGRMFLAMEDYDLARRLETVNWRIFKSVESASRASSEGEFELVLNAANALSERMRRLTIYAELQNAMGSIFASIGHDPLPESVPSNDVATLSWAIETNYNTLPPPRSDDVQFQQTLLIHKKARNKPMSLKYFLFGIPEDADDFQTLWETGDRTEDDPNGDFTSVWSPETDVPAPPGP